MDKNMGFFQFHYDIFTDDYAMLRVTPNYGGKTAKTKFGPDKMMLDHVEPMWFAAGAIQRGNLRKRFGII